MPPKRIGILPSKALATAEAIKPSRISSPGEDRSRGKSDSRMNKLEAYGRW